MRHAFARTPFSRIIARLLARDDGVSSNKCVLTAASVCHVRIGIAVAVGLGVCVWIDVWRKREIRGLRGMGEVLGQYVWEQTMGAICPCFFPSGQDAAVFRACEVPFPATFFAVSFPQGPLSLLHTLLPGQLTCILRGWAGACVQSNNSMEAVRAILAKDPTAVECRRSDDGATPLHVAVMLQDADMVRLLLNNGAVVDARDAQGRTGLHVASLNGNMTIASLLLDKHEADGKDGIDVATAAGQTPMYLACWRGHLELAQRLQSSGASIMRVDNEGKTMLQRAKDWNQVSRLASRVLPPSHLNPVARACFPWSLPPALGPLPHAPCPVRSVSQVLDMQGPADAGGGVAGAGARKGPHAAKAQSCSRRLSLSLFLFPPFQLARGARARGRPLW